jgi:hypothetical protein
MDHGCWTHASGCDGGDYTFWPPEKEALANEARLGKESLDDDENKWVMNVVMREPCLHELS